MVTALAGSALAGAPANQELKTLEKKVEKDLANGTLTKSDGDELHREISEAQSMESRPYLTKATRRDLRQKVGKIQKDLKLKEAETKALAAASPSPA